jgi:Rad3-related DNA helicase
MIKIKHQNKDYCYFNQLDELGNELVKLSSIVPAGIVVFFVSYDYLDKIVEYFKKSKNLMNKIAEKKMVIF